MHPYTNRLIHESSPYLLQHAHNPVDWFPWSEEAFEKAKSEDKPVLVSIGYSACHWCHVMEKESFEKLETAAIMNALFVNIKVDREERPDVDHIYMDALQAISGSGGWPLNIFLTPDRKPFYGGTYFPPQRAFNRASWTEVLHSVAQAYRERKTEIQNQADNLTEHLRSSNSFTSATLANDIFDENQIDEAFTAIMNNSDKEWGGFGGAPKFPQTFTIAFLLRYAHLKKNDEALKQALLSIDKMLQGGIYDQVGGGFARYSTDAEWLAPHFEKMLYDNALLVACLCEAYQLTRHDRYKNTIEETLAFIERELMHENGGFFSALDADSEGEEGKFYVWEFKEATELLGKDATIFCAYFDITQKGNWEGKNIPRIKRLPAEFVEENNISEADLFSIIKRGKEKLLQKRAERIRPALDDKILLSWNALMNTAYSKAFAATGNIHYKEMAEKNMSFLLNSFSGERLHHTWKNNEAKYPAFLDDYSNLISALIELGQVTADYSYFDKASELTEIVLNNFSDQDSPLFFYTDQQQKDIPVRKKEIYDGATPSGNAMMAANLYKLSIVYDKQNWKVRSEAMLQVVGTVIIKYPTSFGVWLSLLFEQLSGTAEITVLGKDWKNYLANILGMYISHKLAMASEKPLNNYLFFAGKAEKSKTYIYLCKNYVCNHPVTTIQEFITLLY